MVHAPSASASQKLPPHLRDALGRDTGFRADTDETKRIHRSRAPIGDFFARGQVSEGDKVVIHRRNPYAYSISKHNA